MPTPNWARITIALAAVVSGSIVLMTGGTVDTRLAKAVASASSVVIVLLLAFDRWIWRWPLVRRLHSRPIVEGTWKTELRTSFPERKDEAIECYLVIHQTYTSVWVNMLFDRSRSASLTSQLTSGNGRGVLFYLFRSNKDTLEPATNPPGRGAAELTVAKEPMVHLEGDYWMEVGTKGKLRTTGYSRKRYEMFDTAKRGDYRETPLAG